MYKINNKFNNKFKIYVGVLIFLSVISSVIILAAFLYVIKWWLMFLIFNKF